MHEDGSVWHAWECRHCGQPASHIIDMKPGEVAPFVEYTTNSAKRAG